MNKTKNKELFCNTLHSDLFAALEMLYTPYGFVCSHFIKESEGAEYCAVTFLLNNLQVKYRMAKITPKKIGQFVTFWKRQQANEPILPYDLSDPIDLFIVSVKDANHFGQFIFPKSILLQKGILSKNGKGGKRAIRVYPPWDITESKQAKATQSWQIKYFIEINEHTDMSGLQKLILL